MPSKFPVIFAVIYFTSIGICHAQDPARKVPVPPLIVQGPPKSLAFREEESLEMTCVGKGQPDPEYYWEFNSEPFNPSGNDDRIAIQPGVGTLIFSRPIKRDAGIYQCFAYNDHGVAASVKVDLRLGILKPFFDQGTRTHYPTLGTSLVLMCKPPVSFPQPKIIWSTVSSDTASEPVELTDRISIDPEGNLNFAHIKTEDKQLGRSYACIVWNDVMRRDQRGSYQKISPTGAIEQRNPPRELWTSPSNQRGLRGDIWRVKCIYGGNPTPRVSWTREGDPMPPKARQESFGQELVLENLQYEDAGKYECEAENSEAMTPERKSFTLKVEAAPFWTNEPMSIDAAEGDTAVFKCNAEGKPQPDVKWFIDGVPITKVPDDPRRKQEGNVITYSNLTIDDAMVFQCNASNKHGYIFSNAYLNVQSEPPTILELPQEDQRVAEGQTVNLTCRVFGSPRPQVIWSKGNEQLTGGNFKVLADGHLQIESVSLVDAGVYTCTATNKWDSTSASGSLTVRRNTRIQTKPMDVMVYEHTEVKFTCTATTDAEEIDNLKIIWKKNGQEIDFVLAQRMFRNNMDNSLTISGTMSLDTAAYTCMATNGIDEDEGTAQLVVQGVPDPPEHIYVRCYENETPPRATVEWQPARENYAPILNFIIQYNTTFAPDQWFDVVSNVSQNMRNIDVELSPWANYTFRVLARNKIGMSQPGEVSRNVCTTLEASPTKNPENVIGEGDEPDNLVIFWTPIPAIDQNGKNFEYIVSWRKANDPRASWDTYTVPMPEYYHHIVTGRMPTYTAYEIRVKSKNEEGEAVTPNTVIGYTGEDVPLIKVTGITIVPGSLTSTDVQLEWEPIKNDPGKIRGFFRGYRIEYWVKGEDLGNIREVNYIVNEPPYYPRPRPRREAVLSTTKKPMVTVYITKLRPNSKINMQVRILNKYYAGPPSDLMEIDTPEGEPGPPRMFEVVGRGPTHYDMAWEQPQQPNGKLVGYNISYQTITGLNLGRLQYREEINDPLVGKARLTGLKPNMDYRVYLSAATAAGKGEPMFVDARTLPAGAPDPPTFGFLGEFGENFVDVNWVPSRGGNPGSVFYVQYRVRGQFDWMHSRNEALKFSMRITELDPGTTYQMRVVAKNGMGLESAAEWQEVTTGGLAPGRIDLSVAAWFYGIFISLILIILFMVLFMIAKRYRDKQWEKQEIKLMDDIEERMRQIQAENAARQMAEAIDEQDAASLDENGPGVGYDDDSDEDEPVSAKKTSFAADDSEEAPPLPEKKAFSSGAYGDVEGFHPGQKMQTKPADPQPSTAPAPAYATVVPYPPEQHYPTDQQYPADGQYPEYQYDPEQYPEGYDQYGGYYGEDGQYYVPDYQGEGYEGEYGGEQYGYDPQQFGQYEYPEGYGGAQQPQVRDGQMHLGGTQYGGNASNV